MKFKQFFSTRHAILDIMMGENVRDLSGNLVDMYRGFKIGKQYNFAGWPAAGKSTLVGDISSTALHLGLPVHQVLIIDADSAAWDNRRIQKITALDMKIIEDKYKVVDTNLVEDLIDELKILDKEYKAMKYKPVKVVNEYSGETQLMNPFSIVIIDTITSLNSELNDVDGKETIIANQGNLTKGRMLASLTNTITNFCNGNIVVIWCSHIKKVINMSGGPSSKQFKTGSTDNTNSIHTRLTQKGSGIFELKAIDTANFETSSTHPRQKYALEDFGTVYGVEMKSSKSRTGPDGRTKYMSIVADGKFDPDISLVVGAFELGILKVSGSTYPSAEYPSVFKENTREANIMGRRRKQSLTVEGYRRPTSILEARLLLTYRGNDKEIIELKNELYLALLNKLEEKLFYELELNNVTSDELESTKSQVNNFFSIIRNVNKNAKIDPNTKINVPEPVEFTEDSELEEKDDE